MSTKKQQIIGVGNLDIPGYQDSPPQDCPLGGQSWGGESWGYSPRDSTSQQLMSAFFRNFMSFYVRGHLSHIQEFFCSDGNFVSFICLICFLCDVMVCVGYATRSGVSLQTGKQEICQYSHQQLYSYYNYQHFYQKCQYIDVLIVEQGYNDNINYFRFNCIMHKLAWLWNKVKEW